MDRKREATQIIITVVEELLDLGATMPTFILHQNNTFTLTGAGADANGKPAPLTTVDVAWTALPTGVVTLAPVTGTNTCKVTVASIGTTVVTATGVALVGGLTVTGQATINTVAAVATQIIITASPEVGA